MGFIGSALDESLLPYWNTLLYRVGQRYFEQGSITLSKRAALFRVGYSNQGSPIPSRLFRAGKHYSRKIFPSRATLFRVGFFEQGNAVPSRLVQVGQCQQMPNVFRRKKAENSFFIDSSKIFAWIQLQSEGNRKTSFFSQTDFVTRIQYTRELAWFQSLNHLLKNIYLGISKFSQDMINAQNCLIKYDNFSIKTTND